MNKRIMKMLAIAGILSFSLLFIPVTGHTYDQTHYVSGYVTADASNVTNTTGINSTAVPGDSAFIEGYYPALDLYVTLPTGTAGPMITPFEINVTAAGQGSLTLYVGKALYTSRQFSDNLIIYDNASYSSTVNLTLRISSPSGSEVLTWSPNFMSPVSYISYEKAKEKAITPGTSYEVDAALGVVTILASVVFLKLFFPGAKYRVRIQWIKEGPKRHV